MNQLEISKFPTLEYAANEAFNTLSTSLFYCGTDIKTILITSRYAVEGKSFVSMNLMRTLASLNKRVVLLDTARESLAGFVSVSIPAHLWALLNTWPVCAR